MALKYRAASNYKSAYESSKGGIAIGIENFIHLRKEDVAGTFKPPSIGTQGKFTGTAGAFSAPTKTTLTVAVDGNTPALVTIVPASCTDGPLTAAELETKINARLTALGQDAQVWVEYSATKYIIYSQKTGPASAVVVTAGGVGTDVTVELNLDDGTGTVGVKGGHFLFMTKAGLKVSQPFEVSAHRTGRQASNIIKKKITAEGDIEMYVCFDTNGGTPLIDTPVADILENIMGRKVDSGSQIIFNAGDPPNTFLSLLQGNNVFARAFNGGYAKSLKISLPGDGEAKITVPFKCRDGKYAALAKLAAPVAGSASVTLEPNEANKFDIGARVMLVGIDGRTVTHGYDGNLTFARTASNTGTLSETVTVADESFMAPWTPHSFDQVGIDNPVTGIQGTISVDLTTTPIGTNVIEEIRSCEISFDPKIEDQDNYYGQDGNRGRVVGGRAEITVDLDVMLSNSQAQHIMESKRFIAKNILVKLGDPAGRHVQFIFPNVQFAVPDIELPDEGSVPLKLSGKCLQSVVGSLDAFSIAYV